MVNNYHLNNETLHRATFYSMHLKLRCIRYNTSREIKIRLQNWYSHGWLSRSCIPTTLALVLEFRRMDRRTVLAVLVPSRIVSTLRLSKEDAMLLHCSCVFTIQPNCPSWMNHGRLQNSLEEIGLQRGHFEQHHKLAVALRNLFLKYYWWQVVYSLYVYLLQQNDTKIPTWKCQLATLLLADMLNFLRISTLQHTRLLPPVLCAFKLFSTPLVTYKSSSSRVGSQEKLNYNWFPF